MTIGRRATAVLVVLGAFMSRRAAALTPAEGVARRQLIADAEKAHNSGDHAQALSLAQRASALEATPSLHYFIAREEEETGAFADGYGTAQQCELEAQHDLQLRGRDEILKKCREIEGRLKDRVGYVVVDVKDRPTGLHVKLSGQDLNEAALGIPYVITPGTIVVEATAPAHSPYRLEISVPEGKTVNVSVTLAPKPPGTASAGACPTGQRMGPQNVCVTDSCQIGMLRTTDGLHCCWPGQTWEADSDRCEGVVQCPNGTQAEGDGCVSVGSLPANATTSNVSRVLTASSPPEQDERGHLRPAYGLTIGAVGVATLVGSTVVWFISGSDLNSAKQSCNTPPGCSLTDYNNDVSRIQRWDKVAATGFIVGGAMTAGGALLYSWAKHSATERDSQRAWLDFNPMNHSAQLSVKF
jgi:hypothetical protein